MKTFSHRKGLKPIKDSIQKDDLDQRTKNRIWDHVYVFFCIENEDIDSYSDFCRQLHTDFFERPIDEFTLYHIDRIKDTILRRPWNEAFDVIEILLEASSENERVHHREMLNGIFEEELVGYRIAGNNQIIDIDSEQEFKAIDEAL